MFIAPEKTDQALNKAYDYVATNLGSTYLILGICILVFLLYLALSKYGNLILGQKDEEPEYGMFGWSAMLFCCGIGASLVLWGSTEWVNYYLNPPFGVNPKSPEAIPWATSYGIFHWGITGWAIYCLPAVAIGYSYHVRKFGSLKTSAGCHAILGDKTNGPIGRFIDLIYMIALLGVLGAGLGFSSPTVSATVTEFFDVEESITITVSGLLVCIAMYSVSVYFGVEKGIQRLSKMCVYMAFFVLLYIFIFGPTKFLIQTSYESLVFVTKNFVTMSIGPPPFGQSEFSKSWTIFYWAWFFGLGPFMGIFVARISRGRTLRTMILGTLGYGTLGCTLFFMIMGNNALYLEINGLMPVIDIWSNEGAAIMASRSITEMALGKWILPFVGIFCLVFMATTFDSGAYTLASSATKKMNPGENPEIWHRIFWAIFIGILPLVLLIGAADSSDPVQKLKPFQTIVLLISPPMLIVYIIMAVGLMKSILEDTKTEDL